MAASQALDLSITDPAELATAIGGRSDAELTEAVAAFGVDAALENAFGAMAARFLPERAAGERAAIQWELDTPEGRRVHTITVEGADCRHTEGPCSQPRVVLGLSTAKFLRLIAGRLNGLQAYSDGDLTIVGDTVVAQLQQTWFDVDLSEARLDISRPSQLRKLLSGRTDGEIEAGIVVTGLDTALDLVFQGMVDHFLPAKTGRKRVVIQFNVRAQAGDRAYQLCVDRGVCSYQRGEHPKPNATLLLRLPNFLRIVAGELDGIRALMQGQIKVRGNILLARSLQGWFDRSR